MESVSKHAVFFRALKVASKNTQIILLGIKRRKLFILRQWRPQILPVFNATNREMKTLIHCILCCNRMKWTVDYLALTHDAGREEVDVGSWTQQIWKCFVPLTICLSCLSRAALSLVICLWVPLSSLDCSLMISVTGRGREKKTCNKNRLENPHTAHWSETDFVCVFFPFSYSPTKKKKRKSDLVYAWQHKTSDRTFIYTMCESNAIYTQSSK